jgi:hypothetical protein
MKIFEKSKWIWLSEGEQDDQYGEFRDSFTCFDTDVYVRISCDSDYTLFVNENYVGSGQYGDFEHYKIYDTVNISEFLRDGENEIAFIVHHCGTATSRYRPAAAGLIYEVTSGEGVLTVSSERTLSRKEPHYVSGACVMVSPQLGYTFSYDCTSEEDVELLPSVIIEKKCEFFERPIKKSALLPRVSMKQVVKYDDTHYLVDLGGEVVGLPILELISAEKQQIKVAWGEHVEDGGVRQIIGFNRFYYEYKAHEGHNQFNEYMLRVGCRYFEVFSEKPIELIYAGVVPQEYEVFEEPCDVQNLLDRKIYDICVNSLKLCMMEHYVDCPWREQALYAFDSRNQILFGYYAFEGGNAEYARANLKLIGMDRRSDGFLSITYPCGIDLVIPSFSLHYIAAVGEYLEHTDDSSLVFELMPKMTDIIDTFLRYKRDGLICVPHGKNYWNFYDWSDNADMGRSSDPVADVLINALFAIALASYEKMCHAVGKVSPYVQLREEILANMRRTFLCENGLFTVKSGCNAQTQLGNALAIISGAATDVEARLICDKLAFGDLTECSLSNKIFIYDVMIRCDSEKYREVILGEIRKNYKIMLDKGSDTVWETLKGTTDVGGGGCGSLCHGWSAVPVYIYHKRGIAKKE